MKVSLSSDPDSGFHILRSWWHSVVPVTGVGIPPALLPGKLPSSCPVRIPCTFTGSCTKSQLSCRELLGRKKGRAPEFHLIRGRPLWLTPCQHVGQKTPLPGSTWDGVLPGNEGTATLRRGSRKTIQWLPMVSKATYVILTDYPEHLPRSVMR